MKSLQKLLIFHHLPSLSKPISLLYSPTHFSCSSSSSSHTNKEKPPLLHTLTQQQLTQINLLIPRLCLYNQIPQAIKLINTALLTTPTPPLASLSLSILIHTLTSQPDLVHPMSFLNHLKHNPKAHPSILPITKMLVSSFFQKGRPKEALKLYSWVARPESPCGVDLGLFEVLGGGFIGKGMVLEGLKVVREMVVAGFEVGVGLRRKVYRGLLREARVMEAQELNEALGCVSGGSGEDGVDKVVELLDHMIANWVE